MVDLILFFVILSTDRFYIKDPNSDHKKLIRNKIISIQSQYMHCIHAVNFHYNSILYNGIFGY